MNAKKIEAVKFKLSNRLRTLQKEMDTLVENGDHDRFQRLQIQFDALLKVDYDLEQAMKG
jgi:hypothetical protein